MKNKKTRILLFVFLLVFCVTAIPTADMIMSSRPSKKPQEPVITEVATTINPELFDPVTDEDVTLDKDYLSLDRSFRYTEGGETIIIVDGDVTGQSRLCRFFGEYFNSIISGDAQKYSSFFNDNYKDSNPLPSSFTKQKLYEMTAVMLSSYYFADGEFSGITRYVFEVNYAIKNNNGSFRNDILSDVKIPLLFEVLSDSDSLTINSVSKYKTSDTKPKGDDTIMEILTEAMPYIWIAVVILGLAVEAMTAAIVAIWFIPGSLLGMILALCGVDIWVQIYTFIILTVILLVLSKTVFKKYFSKGGHTATNLDSIIGMTAIVTEAIDNAHEKGAVKVAGKVWSARSENDILIEAGAAVTVLEIRGVKLICRIKEND